MSNKIEQPAVRQYRILYKRFGAADFATLQPGVHAGIYDVPEVNQGLDVLRSGPACIKAIVVQVEQDLFNIITFKQPAIAPNAFTF